MLNNISLVGRLVKDPELRQTTSGTSVIRFAIAVDREPFNGETKTDFINIVAWGKTAEFVSKYFRKGQLISIPGAELHQEKYTEKDTGKERTTYEVVAQRVRFCGNKADNSPTEEKPVTIADDDGFPF